MKLKSKQNGVTLITALIMLVVLTLMVITSIRSSTSNLRVVSNMQMKEEAVSAAQQATEQIISNNFTISPAAKVIAVPIGGTTYNVSVAKPTCLGSVALQNSTPNLPSECVSSGSAQNTGVVFASGVAVVGTSWCYSQQWEVQSTVVDGNTGASATMHQGVSLDVPAGTSC